MPRDDGSPQSSPWTSRLAVIVLTVFAILAGVVLARDAVAILELKFKIELERQRVHELSIAHAIIGDGLDKVVILKDLFAEQIAQEQDRND